MNRLRIVALLLGIVAASCGTDDPLGRPTTVGVVASGCSLVESIGGGVAVGPGLIATTAHTVAGAREIEIAVRGTRHTAEIVAFDKTLDVAILAVPLDLAPARTADPSNGQSVVVETWHPDVGRQAASATVTKRIIVTIEDIYVEGEYQRQAIEIDSPISAGDSGAPVYDDNGDVLGIVYARSRVRDGVGFAVRSSEIERVLARVGEPVADASRCR